MGKYMVSEKAPIENSLPHLTRVLDGTSLCIFHEMYLVDNIIKIEDHSFVRMLLCEVYGFFIYILFNWGSIESFYCFFFFSKFC